jgi:geranylgeranyl reductase family protein
MSGVIQKQYDVLIVGAGPAGTLAALKLSKFGYKVRVIDILKATKRKVCGEYLCPKGVELLRAEGLAPHFEPRFLPLYGMEIFSPKGKQVKTHFPGYQAGTQGWALNREVFDTELQKLALNAGVEIGFDEKFESQKEENGFVTVKTDKATYRVRVLIGADGRKSSVAQSMGVELHAPTKRVAVHAYLPVRDTQRTGEMHLFADGSYIGVDPTAKQELNISLVCDGEKVREHGGLFETFTHYIRQSKNLYSRLGDLPKGTELWAVSPIHHKVKHQAKGSVALIGDAAGFIDPLTGEGIYNAMLSAQLLSSALIAARALSPAAINLALQNYQWAHQKNLTSKSRLNRMFQWLILQPRLLEMIAVFLAGKQRRADAFVGIIGNVYTPARGFLQMLL